MSDFTWWPDSHSDSFSDEQAEDICQAMMFAPWLVQTPRPATIPEEPNELGLDVDMDRLVLTVQKAWRPAPWTDWPYIYVWRVALSDDWQHWVSGPVQIYWTSGEFHASQLR